MCNTHQAGEMQTGTLNHQVAVKNFIGHLKYYHPFIQAGETKVAISFSYSFGILDKHLQMHFLFGFLICASMTAQVSASTLQLNIWAVWWALCMLSAWQPLPHGVISPPFTVDLWHTNAASKVLPHPVTPLQQWTRQRYCKGIHFLPPTANLPLHFYVVVMINKNNYRGVKYRGGFIHSVWSICNQNKRCSPKTHSQALSASFLQERGDWHGGINISIHGVHFNTVSICHAKYCKTSKTLTSPLKTSSSCAQSLGWGWVGFWFFWVLFILE